MQSLIVQVSDHLSWTQMACLLARSFVLCSALMSVAVMGYLKLDWRQNAFAQPTVIATMSQVAHSELKPEIVGFRKRLWTKSYSIWYAICFKFKDTVTQMIRHGSYLEQQQEPGRERGAANGIATTQLEGQKCKTNENIKGWLWESECDCLFTELITLSNLEFLPPL